MATPTVVGNLIVSAGTNTPSIDIGDLTECTQFQLQRAISSLGNLSNKYDECVNTINAAIAQIINTDNSAKLGVTENGNGTFSDIVGIPPGTMANGVCFIPVDTPQNIQNINPDFTSVPGQPQNTDTPQPFLRAKAITVTPERKKDSKPTSGFLMQDSLSGSDLSVFYLMEIPNQDELDQGMNPDIVSKDLVMLEFDSILSLSYSTIREKFPVRSLGNVNPKANTYGIRTVSGHIGFNIFAEDVLTRLRSQVSRNLENKTSNISNKSPLFGNGYKSMLLDQLPPFHLLVMGTNERGVLSRMLIKDVTIIDENQYQGTQQPNIVNKVTFTALDIVPMTSTQYNSTLINGSLSALEEGFVGGNWDYNSLADMSASSILADSLYRKSIAESN